MAAEIGVSDRVLERAEAGGTPSPANQEKLSRFFEFDALEQWPEPDDGEEEQAA